MKVENFEIENNDYITFDKAKSALYSALVECFSSDDDYFYEEIPKSIKFSPEEQFNRINVSVTGKYDDEIIVEIIHSSFLHYVYFLSYFVGDVPKIYTGNTLESFKEDIQSCLKNN